ncbi:STAS domain-containing protein [Actinoplanes couchii]|uniref:STAS domain-containing protein n=1 Tax=Actinoplanes couchii TaxID=403638 RepID=A0ABQ3XMR7_9ACTN|nr:STAS domain-containing protein [Actinoplanes couchii]MDR6317815.1 anti-anti-sigma factor [Actinoplanes couchii]GID59804.1 hypothetical protein Aco03nite_082080 [Actinoplanes couchii]
MTGPFTVRKHHDGGGAVRIAVSGDIDHDVSEALTHILLNALDQTAVRMLVVDLSGVTHLGAAGVRSLLTGRREANRHGCGFRVVGASDLALDVIRAAGVVRALSVTVGPDLTAVRCGEDAMR